MVTIQKPKNNIVLMDLDMTIIAKVTRDREIERITDHLGIDIGSGYPSDAQTIDAIKDNLANEKFAKFIRQRWKTMQIIRQARMNEFF